MAGIVRWLSMPRGIAPDEEKNLLDDLFSGGNIFDNANSKGEDK
jgi:hypothetical protein